MDWFGDTFFVISTHAPLAGRDIDNYCKNPYKLISTHAPLAGRDFRRIDLCFDVVIFQPTRPLRGATDHLDGESP